MKLHARRDILRNGVAWSLLPAMASLPTMSSAQADSYPARPVEFVIPGTVGGGTYVLARMIADRFHQSTGQAAVVQTAPGASGIVGVQKVTSARADGYTALFGFNQLVCMNPVLLPTLPYNVDRDLQPVSLLAEGAYVWLATNSFPANTLAEWIALASAKPRWISFATSGPGSAANLGAELFMSLTGTEMLHVPYKGDPTVDLIAGVVHLRMEPYATALPLIKNGRAKALAVTGPLRHPGLPGVPAMQELLPGYSLAVGYSVWLPAKTPEQVVRTLNAALVKIVKNPEVEERMGALSVRVIGSTPEELRVVTRQETELWRDLVKKRNIRIDT